MTFFTVPAPRYLSLALFSYLLIISGSVTILLGFFGSLGALKEIKCMLALVSHHYFAHSGNVHCFFLEMFYL